MATLINGNLNDPVYAAQDADLIAAICGNKTCIAPVGGEYAPTLEDANTIMVEDGVIITQEGRRIQLDAGDIDEFLIPTGSQGVTQYYICGYRLYTDEISAELCETFVEPVDSASETITEGTFRSGETEVYVSLLRVKQEGVNITEITELLSKSTDINQINNDLTTISNNYVKKSDIKNNLTSSDTDKPLAALQGKTLRDYIARHGSVTPSNSGKSTLLQYIADVVYPLNVEPYVFSASGFSDLPNSSWGYTIIVFTTSGAITVIAYSHLSNDEYYLRGVNVNSQWVSGWKRIFSGYEVKTFSVNTSDGLYNTNLLTNDYFILSAFINHNDALIATPFYSGGRWYVRFTYNDYARYSANIQATLTCLCLKR